MAEEEKKVTVSEYELRALLERDRKNTEEVAELRSAVNSLLKASEYNPVLTKSNVNVRTAGVCFVEGKPVVGYKNRGLPTHPLYVYEKQDPNDRKNKLLFVDLILDGMKETITVNYNEFLRESEVRQCTILRTHDEAIKITQGTTHRKEWVGDERFETDVVVPLDVEGVFRTYVMKDESTGREFMVPESYLNMKR